MKVTKSNRSRHIKTAVLTSLLIVLAVAFVSGTPQVVHAFPVNTFADVSSCTLPDGSQGVITIYPNSDGQQSTCCPEGATNSVSCLYSKYINPLVAFLAASVGVIVVIGIVYGAVEYITANGDPQRAASGRKRITSALLGLAAFLLLYAFLQFILPGGL